MDGTRKALTTEDVVQINRRMIEQFGGFFHGERNLMNRSSLDYVLEEMDARIYGQELYPTIVGKAAVLAWRVITGHVFIDGNKRTGIEACRLYLELNGVTLTLDMEIVAVAVDIANGQMSIEQFTAWLQARIQL